MSNRKPLEVIPFKNQLEQEIQPGDNILIITTRQHCTNIKVGRYLGKRSRPCYYKPDKIETQVSVEVDEIRRVLRHKETGVEYDYSFRHSIPHPGYKPYRPYGGFKTPEQEQQFVQQESEYNIKKAAYDVAYDAYRSQYEYVEEPYVRKSTLQLNRIFKIHTSAIDFVGKSTI